MSIATARLAAPARPGAMAPGVALAWLIAGAAAARLAFAATTGLGIDESYMVAAGRAFRLGYFDHPPASWWLAAAAAKLAGSEAAVVVRLPFIALFALSTWLMYRLGGAFASPRAGLWAAVALNLSPVFSVTSGSWVLPDGPLIAALLGAALCLARALDEEATPRPAWGFWLGAGLCAGMALFAKYSAVLVIAGAVVFLLTQPAQRRWLGRPQPYVAAAVALAIFAPVVVWNASHDWASFAFQGGRAGAAHLRPLAPLAALAGQALFLAPWVWLPLMAALWQALRRGRAEWRGWLFVCLGAPTILMFTLIAAIADRPVLYHWAAPGYLMLFPLLGAFITARLDVARRFWRGGLVGAAAFLLFGVTVVASHVRFNWLPNMSSGESPAMDAVDWTDLREAVLARGGPPPLVAGLNWRDTGKIDYTLHGAETVFCLCQDARQYGLNVPPGSFVGQDVLVVVKQGKDARAVAELRPLFASLEELPPVVLTHAGRPAITLSLILGHGLRSWPAPKN